MCFCARFKGVKENITKKKEIDNFLRIYMREGVKRLGFVSILKFFGAKKLQLLAFPIKFGILGLSMGFQELQRLLYFYY